MIDYEKQSDLLASLADVRAELDRAAEAVRDGQGGAVLKLLRGAAVGISDIAEIVQHGQVCHIPRARS